MGTPEFAVPCLDRMVKEGYDVVGVVTQTDKPKGRGKKLTPPPVKEYALDRQIAVYQPSKLKKADFEETLKAIQPDLIIVVAYGKILPKYVLEYPPYGCINVHASLLPKYRGAGPIQWCVINGEEETGITTMYMDEGLDTGDMILKKKIAIGRNETAGELHDRLASLGSEVLKETLEMVVDGKAPRTPQSDSGATYAPMLDKSTAKIDWHKSAKEIKDLVRGVNPWPVAYTYYKDEMMKVWFAEIGEECKNGIPGTIVKYLKHKGLAVKAGDDCCVLIKEVQFKGGKRMDIDDYLRGHSIEYGEILS